jgi:NAD(P)-dependent dehydrogenase (short-subunit alcohol dehydrogenase family)
MQLKDKIVVITGAAKGLGKSMSDAFASAGAVVVATDRSTTDVTDEDQVRVLGSSVVEKYGKIDIWVNNAGIWLPPTPILGMDTKRVREMFDVNLFGTINGSRVALDYMTKQGNGIIVNILSTAALEGKVGLAGYVASKFAIDGFTKTLRLETEGTGIKVISVYPGGTKTNLYDGNKPADYEQYMESDEVARKIVSNLEQPEPLTDLILKRPKV